SFRAAARTHLATGLTISTHAAWFPVGLRQLDILEGEGVLPHARVFAPPNAPPRPSAAATSNSTDSAPTPTTTLTKPSSSSCSCAQGTCTSCLSPTTSSSAPTCACAAAPATPGSHES